MIQRHILTLWLSALSACALSLDPNLDGKRCDDQGACVAGYTCSPFGVCVRAGEPSSASITDAHVASSTDAAPTDARVATNVPDAAPADARVADPPPAAAAPDSSVADAGRSDAAMRDPADPAKPTQQPATTKDAGVATPPPPTMPPTMMMPVTPPVAGRAAREPPPPATPPPPPGMMMSCPVETTKCRDMCVDLQKDLDHCGACNHACKQHEQCKDGTCKKPSP